MLSLKLLINQYKYVLCAFFLPIIIAVVFWFLTHSFDGRFEVCSDVKGFHVPVARNLLDGKGYVLNGERDFNYPPLYAFYLAFIIEFSRVLSISEQLGHVLFTLLVVGLTSLSIYAIGICFWGRPSVLIAVLAWAVYPFWLWLTRGAFTENLFIFLIFCGFALLLNSLCRRRMNPLIYFFVGLILGFAALVRPIGIGLGVLAAILSILITEKIRVKLRFLIFLVILLGNVVAISPWVGWVYYQSGEYILLSTRGGHSIWDGVFFGVRENRKEINLPSDVKELMHFFYHKRHEEWDGISVVGTINFLKEGYDKYPLAFMKLAGIKLLRCWYATDSRQHEKVILVIQAIYLLFILWGTRNAWKLGSEYRRLVLCVWFICVYFWGMTFMVLSIVRYMVPAMGFLVLLLPAIGVKKSREG